MNEMYEQAEALQNMLVSQSTGGRESNTEYTRLRQIFITDSSLCPFLPRFVRTCRSLSQFWEFIKHKFSTYAERRTFIWDEFSPFLETLEKDAVPSDSEVTSILEEYDSAHVQSIWSKALDRRAADPEGAITMARTLLESVCKHILDECSVKYDDTVDLPKLYRLTAENLNLSPSQHSEDIFKRILGGCISVVEGLGTLRNKLSDSHGSGKRQAKPAPRHAELAVNLAGAMSAYLISTWQVRNEESAC
jgi:hypothetical protein